MKIYKQITQYAPSELIKPLIFTKEVAEEVVSYFKGERSESRKFHFVVNENPKHQQLCSIFLSFDEYNGNKYHDIFVSKTILLPSIKENLPREYEVYDEIIWEWTNDPEDFISKFVGMEYVESVGSNRIVSNGFSAKEDLIQDLLTLYGYETMDEINKIVEFDVFKDEMF